jgi:starvation-inducible DNA-binding protein
MAETGTSNTPRAHKTRNNTDSNAKKVSIEALNARLADGIDLALAIKQAHWNLKGPQFIGVHLMLDGFRTELDDLNDKVAERAVQLGATAFGSTQAVAERTKLPPYPTGIYATAVRQTIAETDEAGDPDTADLFTEISRAVDKHLWFLEAHVQEPTGTLRDGNQGR